MEKQPTESADFFSPEELLNTHQELRDLQAKTLTQLSAASGAEERVKLFGEIVDDYGADALVSLFAGYGDVASSALSSLYLLFEANNAGLDKKSYLKIIGLQTADIFVGAVPLIGDIADYFFKASKWSTGDFEKRTAELEIKAKQLGVSEEHIMQLRKDAAELPQIITKVLEELPASIKDKELTPIDPSYDNA